VRKTYLLMSCAALALAACSTKKTAANDDLKKDLDMASTSDGIALASSSAKGSQVVSAIERTSPPAPRYSKAARRRGQFSSSSPRCSQ